MAKISSNSRFKLTDVVSYNGKRTFGRWVPPGFMERSPQELFIVPPQLSGRADLISYRKYGTPDYYWAIIAYNAPRNPLNWPAAGETIRIPNIADIASEL